MTTKKYLPNPNFKIEEFLDLTKPQYRCTKKNPRTKKQCEKYGDHLAHIYHKKSGAYVIWI